MCIQSVPELPHENFVRLQCKNGRKGIFKTTIVNESLYEFSNGNWVRVITSATSYIHLGFHDETIHSQMGHVFLSKTRHSIAVMSGILEELTVILTIIWWL